MNLNAVLAPSSIAVIGASREPGTVGNAVLTNLITGGYTGVIYPVNPKAKAISGVRCYKSIADIPDEVDMAVIIVRSGLVPDVIEACGEKGVKGAIVISAGFKEIGGEGYTLEETVKAIARRYGIALIGPNCLGVINTDINVQMNASFATAMPARGHIGFISQSGALCTAVLEYAQAEGIGFSQVISMGNKAGATELDLLCALHNDPNTRVILMYVEDLSQGARFIEVAREITGEGTNPKPILVVKSGRTPEGAKAASSHTGSLAGSEEVYDAIFAQGGVIRVDTVDELFDYALAFANNPLPKGRKVGIITNAGGPGIMTTDACIRYGLEIAKLSPDTVEAMRPKLPLTASLNNPVDVIGDARDDRYAAALEAVSADPEVDSLLVLATPQSMTNLEEIAGVIAETGRKLDKPVLTCFMGVVDLSHGIKVLEQNHMVHYRFPEAAVRALEKLAWYSEWVNRPRTTVREYKADKDAGLALIAKARAEDRLSLTQSESMELLEAYGLPVPGWGIAHSAQEAATQAESIGYPIVIKVLSADIIHKFDVGGVKLNLGGAAEVEAAYTEMMATLKTHCPDAKIEGVLLQKMVPQGLETIVGMKRDKQFGPLVMFGLGGIYVEVFKDVTFRLAPVRELGAELMVHSIRARKLLEGYRGAPATDQGKVVECIQRISQLSLDLEEIAELDVNPLIVYAEGKGAYVADARVILTDLHEEDDRH